MRRARIESDVDDPGVVASALRPDDTDEIRTRVAGGSVIATIERETTSGLRSTLDDYVVNLGVALEVAQYANRRVPAAESTGAGTDTDKSDEPDTKP